ncbi:DUF5666 domain-containing protein [Photobacterium sanguinicancri]|uniref:DUF5666 domain-containing protein n=1 Tax=Photobacterium sanguinicancri TaxID=875932 RepID=A0AAW7Y131_9GAMM|nr:DUF5666 domain-containing protein [Photobacterium sanguinicancri]MDO6541139.1 DUF5666 domain-containing protein [Photobacterium sanguinicancri]
MKLKALVTVISLALVGCGGSDSSDSSVKKSGTLDGKIQSLNASTQSLSLHGEQLSAANAKISYEGKVLQFSNLDEGMRVKLTANNGDTNDIKLNPTLVGKVTKIDGTKVTVDGVTFEYKLDDDIEVGDWVLVTGYTQADSSIKIVSVKEIADLEDDQHEFEGAVTDLDTNNQTFKIGPVEVAYSGASIDKDDDQKFENGSWVEVYGRFENSVFNAVKVELEDDNDYKDTEVEGVLTWVNQDKTQIEINGRIRAEVTAKTEFDDGEKSDLKMGRWVEVDLQAQGDTLWAKDIEFDDEQGEKAEDFELKGNASSVDQVKSQFELDGKTIIVNAKTEFDDDLTMDKLDGEAIDVEGVIINSEYVAKEIERQD